MRVKVKDLLPNPYRRIKKYPIDRDKVNALKNSIKETEFWDNILAREIDGKYQIAYGHHRLTAIIELGIVEIDIPVKKIDDATMLKIMANENMDDWKLTVSVINETVGAAKEFIEHQGKNYKTYQEGKKFLSDLQISEKDYHALKNNKYNVGSSPIKLFLGSNWQEHVIKQSLQAINGFKDHAIDKKAVEVFTEQRHAKVFMEEVRAKKIPVEKQKDYADKIVDKITTQGGERRRTKNASDFSGQDIREASYDIYTTQIKKDHPERFQKNEAVKKMEFIELAQSFVDAGEAIEDIARLIKDVPFEYRERFNNKITNLIDKLTKIRGKNNGK